MKYRNNIYVVYADKSIKMGRSSFSTISASYFWCVKFIGKPLKQVSLFFLVTEFHGK